MKKFLFVSLMLAAGNCLYAQSESDVSEPGKNIIKLNLPALALKNFSVQYERAIAKKISVAATFRYMAEGKVPLKSTFVKLADDPDTERQLNNLNVGNMAVMPEVRFYLGKKGVFRGFYLGPFASIARYSADLLYEYDDAGSIKTMPLSGDVNSFTGGLMIGAQWKLSKRVYLDWWILGANYGTSKGDISGQQKLSASEQQSLRDELDELDVPLTKFTYVVNESGATVNFKGPWAGVRSGICIGINF
jgi:hypothetical protein